MKFRSKPTKSRLTKLAALALVPLIATSCMTTYDAQGNPVQSVDPGLAAAGIAAAAAIGYAAANNHNDHYYYGRRHYRGSYCRY
ncbi:hypothetical protein [Haloferula sp.]|uniref:hypothetical protein n=1 Tax=Haloferula sp. TaxID=2497595 RepID=UPI00329EC77D